MNPSETNSKKLSAIIFAVIPLSVILWITIRLTIQDQAIYLILFSLFYVLIPGFISLKALDKDIIERFGKFTSVIAFFFGFFLLVVQYYLLNAIGCLSFIRFTPILLTLLIIVIFRKRIAFSIKKFDVVEKLSEETPFFILTAILMVATYHYFFHMLPTKTSDIFIDFLYHMGNINILTRGGSLEDTRVLGMTFKYHYFADLYYAILRRVFPADIWRCVARYPILYIAPLISRSTYALISSKTKNKVLCVFIPTLMALFSSISPTSTLMVCNLLTSVNGVGFALPIAIVIVEVLVKSAEKKSMKLTDLVILFALTLVLTGSKGPFTLAVIGAFVIFIIYMTIDQRKLSLMQIAAFITIVVSFAIIWFTLLNVAVNDSNIQGESTGILKYIKLEIPMPNTDLTRDHAPDSKHAMLFFPINILYSFGGAAFPLMLLVPNLILALFCHREKKKDYRLVFCAICGCMGIGGDYFLNLGRNRTYFLMFAIPFVYFSAIGCFEMLYQNRKKVVLVLTTLFLMLNGYYMTQAIIENSLYQFYPWKIGSISENELEAINWIKENTDEDALFAINGSYINGKAYYYSAFTERRYYLESYSYSMNSGKTHDDLEDQIKKNDALYNDSSSREIADELNIDYIVYYDAEKVSAILENNYTLCYSNDEIRIYSTEHNKD